MASMKLENPDIPDFKRMARCIALLLRWEEGCVLLAAAILA